jgi:hypothetical protein
MIKYYKTTVSVTITILIIIALFIISLTSKADNGNSQQYRSARYVILAGEVNAAMLNSGGNHLQKVLVKMDTSTGQTWIMQLSVTSHMNPKVRDAVWAPIKNNGQFSPYNNNGNNFDQSF